MKDTIEIDGVQYQRVVSPGERGEPYVIVRCRDAGVHAGYLVSQDGRTVQLRNSRRCWKFTVGGIGSCSELSQRGLIGESRIAQTVTGVATLMDACEVLPTTSVARDSIEAYNAG